MEIREDELIPVYAQIEVSGDMIHYCEYNGKLSSLEEDNRKHLANAIVQRMLDDKLIDFQETDDLDHRTYSAKLIIYKRDNVKQNI
jgi:hypothetical protein